jgi:hypothetical protein
LYTGKTLHHNLNPLPSPFDLLSFKSEPEGSSLRVEDNSGLNSRHFKQNYDTVLHFSCNIRLFVYCYIVLLI